MTQSAQRTIRAAVAAQLRVAPAVAATIYENRPLPLPQGVDLQVHVNYRSSVPDRMAITGAPIDWDTTIEVVVKARSTAAGLSAEDAADAAWYAIYARVMGDQKLGLVNVVALIEPGGAEVTDDEVDTDVCELTWTFNVRHSTGNNTLDPR